MNRYVRNDSSADINGDGSVDAQDVEFVMDFLGASIEQLIPPPPSPPTR